MAKTSALRIRIDPGLHRRFLDTCKARDIPASQVLREYMRQFVSTHEQTSQPDFFIESNAAARPSIEKDPG